MSKMKPCEVRFTQPPASASGASPLNKSFGFQQLMQHSRACHRKVMTLIADEGLTPQTGASTLIANEGRMTIDCTEDVMRRLAALPFVASVSEVKPASGKPTHKPPRV